MTTIERLAAALGDRYRIDLTLPGKSPAPNTGTYSTEWTNLNGTWMVSRREDRQSGKLRPSKIVAGTGSLFHGAGRPTRVF